MVFGRKKRPLRPELAWPEWPKGQRPAVIVMAMIAGFGIAAILIRHRRLMTCLQIENVEVEDAADLVEQEKENPDFVILDVRTPSEYERGHIEVSLPVNYRSGTFESELNKLDKEKVYLVYSGHGERSARAAVMMKNIGFRTVFHLEDGLSDWERKGFPVVQ